MLFDCVLSHTAFSDELMDIIRHLSCEPYGRDRANTTWLASRLNLPIGSACVVGRRFYCRPASDSISCCGVVAGVCPMDAEQLQSKQEETRSSFRIV
jgi:hypothetical protein